MRRLLRVLLIAVLAVVAMAGMAVFCVLAFFATPSARNQALRFALPKAARALPGELTVARARWPRPDSLWFDDILWTDREDTLVQMRTLSIDADLPALARKDIHVRSISLLGLRADVPAIIECFSAKEKKEEVEEEEKETSPDDTSGGGGFPRDGSLHGVPSLGADRLVIDASRVILPGDLEIRDVTIVLAGDLLAGRPPRVLVDSLAARMPSDSLQVTVSRLEGALDPVRVSGDVHVVWKDQPFLFRLRGEEPGRVLLDVSEVPERAPRALAVRLDARVRGGVTSLQGAAFEGTASVPGTKELLDVSFLAGILAGWPELEGMDIRFSGDVALEPSTSGWARVAFDPNDWLLDGAVAASFHDSTVVLDSLRVRVPDLEVEARGRLEGNRLDARARAQASGARWMSLVAPDAKPPDSLTLDVVVSALGPVRRPALEGEVDAAGRIGGFTLDRVTLKAGLPEAGPVSLDVRAEAFDVLMAFVSEIDLAKPVVARFSVVKIVPEGNDVEPGPLVSRVVFDAQSKHLIAEGFRVEGAYGDLELDADVNGTERGVFQLDWRIPAAPPILTRSLEESDSLDFQKLWEDAEDPRLAITGSWNRESGGMAGEAAADLLLPAPGVWKPFLPEDADVDSLGPFRGSLEIAASPRQGETFFDASVDLSETDWIDSGILHAHGASSDAVLDSLVFVMQGFAARGEGRLDGDRLDGALGLQLTDLSFVRRCLGMDPEALEGNVIVEARVAGLRSALRVEIDAAGGGRFRDNELQDLTARAAWEGGAIEANLDTRASLRGGRLLLDRVHAAAASEGDSLFPLRATIDLEGEQFAFRNAVRLSQSEGWTAEIDSLAFRLRQRELRSMQPARITVNQKEGWLRVEGLDLQGSLATIAMDGFAGKDSASFEADVRMNLPDSPELVAFPAAYWPDSLSARVRTGPLRAELRATGLQHAGRDGVTASVIVSAADSVLDGSVRVEQAGVPWIEGEAQFPARLTLYPPSLVACAGPVKGDIRVEALPVPLSTSDPKAVGRLNGELHVSGDTASPRADLSLDLDFQEWMKLQDYRIHIQGDVGGGPGEDSLTAASRAEFVVTRHDAPVLTGKGTLPLRLSLIPFTAASPPEAPVEGTLRTETLTLSDFDPLLPPDVRLLGTAAVSADVSGTRAEPVFEGNLQGKGLGASLADGSRVVADVSLDFSGTTKRPSVSGEIRVLNGVIRVPEKDKNLLPVSGESLLWQSEAWARTMEDSVLKSAAPPDTMRRGSNVDLDVRVLIPGNLWVRGRQMEIELDGDLRLVQKGGKPTVTGELNAIRGTLTFVGRNFEVERGKVSFFGDDELNPSLNVELTADVDQYTFRIALTGTALEPKVNLTSEPTPMDEGDIMCYLLFGEPCNNLGTDQAALVGRLAASYASAELTEKLSGSLGVDMISIRSGSEGQSSAVTVGKYLSQKLLLKYEQTLDDAGTFFLNLEYLISRRFKLNTIYGGESSGMEIRWGLDY